MKKVFQLRWVAYEEEESWYYYHNAGKTESQFRDEVLSLLRKYGNEFIESMDDMWIGSDGWIGYIADRLSELGYCKVEPTQVCFGATGIIKEYDRKAWEEVVGKELCDKAIDTNSKIEAEMYKSYLKKRGDSKGVVKF